MVAAVYFCNAMKSDESIHFAFQTAVKLQFAVGIVVSVALSS